jgi:hypothetical protein
VQSQHPVQCNVPDAGLWKFLQRYAQGNPRWQTVGGLAHLRQLSYFRRRVVRLKARFRLRPGLSLASRRALLPPRISFIIRSATTPFASTANIIKELIIRRPL